MVVGSQLRVGSSRTLVRLYGRSSSTGGGVGSRTGSLSTSLNEGQYKRRPEEKVTYDNHPFRDAVACFQSCPLFQELCDDPLA